MNKWKKWEFWGRVRKFSEKRMKSAWMQGGNCTSACRNCRQWEHLGNKITNADQPDGSVLRRCGNCGKEWLSVFTPVGFIPVTEFKQPKGAHEADRDE